MLMQHATAALLLMAVAGCPPEYSFHHQEHIAVPEIASLLRENCLATEHDTLMGVHSFKVSNLWRGHTFSAQPHQRGSPQNRRALLAHLKLS
eukprot:c21928_g2_i1 orf=423-698(+)